MGPKFHLNQDDEGLRHFRTLAQLWMDISKAWLLRGMEPTLRRLISGVWDYELSWNQELASQKTDWTTQLPLNIHKNF